MSTGTAAATVFAALTGLVVGFQVALALGLPWGSYAMGGAFPGKYPAAMRLAALVQAAILVLIAASLLSIARVVSVPWGATPAWIAWVVSGLLGIGLVLNLITPSRVERRIWAPTVGVMLVCSMVVGFVS